MLNILIEFGLKLPRTKLSLISCKRKNIVCREVPPGKYLHIGISKAIQRCGYDFLETETEIMCDFNVDGLPLYKSSRKTIWPILGAFANMKNKPSFLVGAWVGEGHPKSSDLFFEDFCKELKTLKNNGRLIGNNKNTKKFTLRAIICDAPAKAFCKSVKYHNSNNGCHECDQTGFRFQHTPVYNIVSGKLRTDESFSTRADEQHHNNQHQSMLEKSSIGMVSQFPIDPMHLVDLGIAKKMLMLIVESFDKNTLDKASQEYVEFAAYTPMEFARKPRDLKEIVRWKATEFRFFILYAAMLFLPNESEFPFQIENFLIQDEQKVMAGRRFINLKSYFEEPINSKLLYIFDVSETSEIETIPVSCITGKFCRLPIDLKKRNFILIKMLHESEKNKFI